MSEGFVKIQTRNSFESSCFGGMSLTSFAHFLEYCELQRGKRESFSFDGKMELMGDIGPKFEVQLKEKGASCDNKLLVFTGMFKIISIRADQYNAS